MPAVVIRNIRNLMGVLASYPHLDPSMVLAEGDCPKLSDDAIDLIDDIKDGALNVFGRMKPTAQQERLMADAGFPLAWGAGLIRTPKGNIRYK